MNIASPPQGLKEIILDGENPLSNVNAGANQVKGNRKRGSEVLFPLVNDCLPFLDTYNSFFIVNKFFSSKLKKTKTCKSPPSVKRKTYAC